MLKGCNHNISDTAYIIKLDLSGYVVTNFEPVRRHFVYTISKTTTIAVTNEVKSIKVKLLIMFWEVSIKQKMYFHTGFQKGI